MILSMVAALGLTLEPQNIKCAKLTAKSKNYISRMKLFETLRIPFNGGFIEHESSGRFIPLRVIQDTEEKTQLIKDIIPLLHLQSEPEQAKTISYILTELVDNVLEHACTPVGAIICAQYYQDSNCIRIGIADTGRGIKKAINQSHPASTHIDAIQLALWPGITGTTKREGGTDINAGAGLFFVKSIANVNRDFFVIYSGSALYKMLKKTTNPNGILTLNSDPFKDRHSKNNNLPFWKGTVVGIDITLDQTKEFLFLLQAIRKTYSKAVKERRKARYKAKFI